MALKSRKMDKLSYTKAKIDTNLMLLTSANKKRYNDYLGLIN